ncbi:MAG: NAD(P)H-dependent glycerol-3-phosphate dehydrogenase [Pseudomonadota bacterium]
MSDAPQIGVLGAGAWGTALAQLLASDGRAVRLWAREVEVAEAINTAHENPVFLPGQPLSAQITTTDDLTMMNGLEALLVVTPAQHMRSVLQQLETPGALVLCCKGIEASSGRFMTDIANEIFPDAPIAVLSGPTFAHEVAAGKPTAVTLSCTDDALWEQLAPMIARRHFRPYRSRDMIGAEIGGAVKNVLAIACGVVDGLGLGQNARAALISRGFAEMVRFGVACGAEAETLNGLSGLGDLVLTCSSERSRNFALGRSLGEGESAQALMTGRTTVAEGAHTAPVLQKVAQARDVDMPIVDAVCTLLSGVADAQSVVEALLSRPLGAE